MVFLIVFFWGVVISICYGFLGLFGFILDVFVEGFRIYILFIEFILER